MQKIEATLLTMVIVHDEKRGEILLVNRPSKLGFPGYLGPGGKIELTESFAEGAVRELREETGLLVNPEDLIYKGVDEYILVNEGVYDDEKLEVGKWFTKRAAVSCILHLPNTVGIPLQTQYKLSKGKSFVEFINQADDGEIIKLVTDLIEYIEYQNIEDLLTVEKRNLYPKLKALMSKFSTNQTFSSTLVTDVKEKFNDVYIASQLSIMMSLVEESPSDVIGKSKELLESCFKHILDEFDEEYSPSSTVAQLRKQVFLKLNLDPKENVSAKNNNDVKKILSSFIQVVDGLNSLRNDKGDGHGKGKNYTELPVRYAKLAMNASLTIVHFTWDTYKMHIGKYK